MTEIKPQFIKTAGVELVVLTRAEYDALIEHLDPALEDEADVILFDIRMEDLRSGLDERLPAEVTALMLHGDSLLRAVRKWRRTSQADLARAVNLTENDIDKLESGTTSGASGALYQIASALNVPPAWISTGTTTQE